ncbi:MAG: sugar ABC transporter substrate-binding protein [Firmicutes bacterium]|nr:sugar ABC transporter substrate-binding protein [Bacillota bacterium]
MKMSKRILVLALVVMMMVSVVACGGSKTEVNPDNIEKDDPPADTQKENQQAADISTVEGWAEAVKGKSAGKTINVVFASHPSSEALKKMTPEFEKLTGIKVNWKLVEETQLKNDQLLDFTSNAGNYDVYMVDRFWLDEYEAKDVLMPLNDIIKDSGKTPVWFDHEDIMAAYRDGLTKIGDTYYGIPLVGETRFVGYRTDLFEKYDKEPPKTMDELLELAVFFNGKEPDLYGIAMRAQKGIHCASGWMTLMYSFCDGFIDQKTGKSLMDDAKTLESLKFYADLLKNAPPDVSTYTHEEAMGAFASGKTAMWLDATALVPVITNPSSSKIADKVAFVPTPEGPYGKAAALAGWGAAIPNSAKSKDEGWAFLMYMTSKALAVDYYNNGGSQTRKSIYENAELIAKDASLPAQLEALDVANELVKRGLSWIPPHEKLGQILDIVGRYGNQTVIGEITPEDACEKAHKELEDLLN